jgi:glycosyltransferase involved in cell wall biosynthesis
MILAFEMIWTGTIHAPGNFATLQTIALAWPEQQIRMFAEESHLRELRANPPLPNLSFHPVRISPLFPGRTQIVSPRRGLTEFGIIRAALAAAPAGESCLIMLISATPTAVLAASLAARLTRRRVGIQVGLHGNLNDIAGWRPRNPLLRRFDLRSIMAAPRRLVRYLVLEDSIKTALVRMLPACASCTDVLPLPINATELRGPPTVRTPHDGRPRIGFVGLATEAKGIDIFLRLAEDFSDRIDFTLVGRASPGTDLAPFAALADPVGTTQLPREDFLARLAGLDYVMLPFRPGYYDLAASGALIDAITWLKPVIVTDLPFVADMFNRFGDIGHLCAGEAGLRGALEDILAAWPHPRYGAQVMALRQARHSRNPAALARQYRALTEAGFPGLLG